MAKIGTQSAGDAAMTEKPVPLDDLDRKILVALQRDATRSLDALASELGASKTPVWNRIRRLRASGVIAREVAVLDPDAVGLSACFFVLVRTSQHEPGWLEKFTQAVQSMPEIVSAHRLAGEIDYVLQVRVTDPRAYDAFYRRLIAQVSIFNVTSLLSMEEMKATTELPLPQR
jgi:Lrp/AsnC family transcriptional regulator